MLQACFKRWYHQRPRQHNTCCDAVDPHRPAWHGCCRPPCAFKPSPCACCASRRGPPDTWCLDYSLRPRVVQAQVAIESNVLKWTIVFQVRVLNARAASLGSKRGQPAQPYRDLPPPHARTIPPLLGSPVEPFPTRCVVAQVAAQLRKHSMRADHDICISQVQALKPREVNLGSEQGAHGQAASPHRCRSYPHSCTWPWGYRSRHPWRATFVLRRIVSALSEYFPAQRMLEGRILQLEAEFRWQFSVF